MNMFDRISKLVLLIMELSCTGEPLQMLLESVSDGNVQAFKLNDKA